MVENKNCLLKISPILQKSQSHTITTEKNIDFNELASEKVGFS
jgi:hypothetical protein